MKDFQWLAIATAIIAVICFVISAPDRRAARHWWRRRSTSRPDPRGLPWGKVISALLPLFLLVVASALLLWAWLRHPELPKS